MLITKYLTPLIKNQVEVVPLAGKLQGFDPHHL